MSKPKDWPAGIPYIDSEVKWRGVSEVRKFGAKELSELSGAVVFHLNGRPLTVMVPYMTYVGMQNSLKED